MADAGSVFAGKCKNRPAFAGENQVTKEEMTAFYREEAETHRYLKEYDGFDARQLRKMTHLENLMENIFSLITGTEAG